MISAFNIFGGVADLFLSMMLWFILDSETSIVLDGGRVYAVAHVIDTNQSVNYEDCEDEVNAGKAVQSQDTAFSSVSGRMIEQFFTEVEGPDRDWSDFEYEEYEQFERD